jgi:pimeloyl-ACP methyl ester carboxylesterase
VTDQPRTPGKQRTVEADGRALAYTEYAGSGPPLVLLHGIGSRGVGWWPVIDGLTTSFKVYALDLRGHGDSAKPDAGYDLPDYASDLEQFLNALGLAKPLVMGHSLGALVTMTWATEYPERAAAIVLEDPPLRVFPDVGDLFADWIALAAMPLEQVEAVYQEQFPEWTAADRRRRAESITATAPAVFTEARDRFLAQLATSDPRPATISDRLPRTLLIYADPELGGMVSGEEAQAFEDAVPNATVGCVVGAGHNIHRDRPDEFLALAVPFLRSASDM